MEVHFTHPFFLHNPTPNSPATSSLTRIASCESQKQFHSREAALDLVGGMDWFTLKKKEGEGVRGEEGVFFSLWETDLCRAFQGRESGDTLPFKLIAL